MGACQFHPINHNKCTHIVHYFNSTEKTNKNKIIIYLLGASLNPAPDNTRYNSGGGHGYDNRYAGNQPPVDPNAIFGTPNRQPAPQPNQPWSNQPIFPNPTSHRSYPQQPAYPQAPFPYPPGAGSNTYGNRNPYQPQQPFAFGHQPPSNYNPTSRTGTPSLLDQFLYNKQGGRRRNSATLILPSNIIYIISLCSVLFASIITFRGDRH